MGKTFSFGDDFNSEEWAAPQIYTESKNHQPLKPFRDGGVVVPKFI